MALHSDTEGDLTGVDKHRNEATRYTCRELATSI